MMSSVARAPSPRLAGQHFAAAMLYLIAGAIGLVWIAPDLAAGNYLSPHVAGVTHLFTLGWLTTTIFGALCQLLPVALRSPLRWPRLGDVSFWSFAPGAGLFACGVAANSAMLHHTGLALITLGIVIAVTNIAATLVRAPMRDATWAAMAIALTFLASTLVLGVVLLHNLHTGFIAAARLHVLATHLHVAIVGWALVMVVGVSNRLLPMFLLAHGVHSRWTTRSLVLLTAGLPLLAVGLNTGVAVAGWLGVIAIELGVICFMLQAYTFYRARVRKQIEVGMRFAFTAVAFLAAATVLGPVVFTRGPSATRIATTYIVVGLLGGIVLYVAGFFYKIVPLLSWTARYRGQMSTPGVPRIAEMYSARVALLQLVAMASGLVTLALAILLGVSAGAIAGAALFLIGVLLFATQMLRVAQGGRFGGFS
jgi:hypothetical protein